MRAAVILLIATRVCAATIPSGTEIQIRLLSPVNTATVKADQRFDAVVIAPVIAGGRIVMSAGVKVSGHIADVKAANQAANQSDQQASLTLAFDQATDGVHRASITAKVTAVDNARESVEASGQITGIKASDTGSARLDQGINKVTEKYPGLGEILGAVKQAVVKETDANIDYEAGVEMTIALTKPLDWTGSAAVPAVKPIQPEAVLARLVSAQPYRTMAEKPPRPSDVTNLMFLGSQSQIEAAFEKAGWSRADVLNSKSKLETFRAMTEARGYKEAPVSVLFLDSAPPGLVFEKGNDTFNARHHLRIWHRPGLFNGQEVWMCAATHDTGIDFSEQNRTFIHKIDSRLDVERAKVVNDLLFTGLVQRLSLVTRELPAGMTNATGDSLQTDGSLAVIAFAGP
ncbi:MAG TPA: LssY C-terminal domain-containing protein [Bryobacteraceae bacterium]|nr:LssY C-terminal domain-containing protein [Bryobacteraceae bacterium]